ncbi:hypothetical protein BDZ97DRAFT_587636 [Flammula alnicola]|nr:hypothetical protein BDZ97DRAFT_587636 [Flammula alnicola]
MLAKTRRDETSKRKKAPHPARIQHPTSDPNRTANPQKTQNRKKKKKTTHSLASYPEYSSLYPTVDSDAWFGLCSCPFPSSCPLPTACPWPPFLLRASSSSSRSASKGDEGGLRLGGGFLPVVVVVSGVLDDDDDAAAFDVDVLALVVEVALVVGFVEDDDVLILGSAGLVLVAALGKGNDAGSELALLGLRFDCAEGPMRCSEVVRGVGCVSTGTPGVVVVLGRVSRVISIGIDVLR